MKIHRQAKFAVASLALVVLFVALWKAAAPFRIRKQFETQMLNHLKDKKFVRNEKTVEIVGIRITYFHLERQANMYVASYRFYYTASKDNQLLATKYSCGIYGDHDIYQGQCPVPSEHIALSHDSAPIIADPRRGVRAIL